MNIISDFEAHKRDEEFDAAEDRRELARERLAAHRLTLVLQCLPNCIVCQRTMLPGDVYENGFTDGPSLCNRCKESKITYKGENDAD